MRRLELFGSAGSGHFDAASSDLDFLVEFEDLPSSDYAQYFFGLLHGLEDLFLRPIDLVTTRALSNPYFIQAIERDRTVLYAA